MTQNQSIEIYGLNNYISYCEAAGLSNCFKAYADNCAGQDIMEIGFNPNSGYTYIALEDGISICSHMGGDVEYLVTNMNDGTEYFLSSYRDAEEKIKELQEDN
jgi:hypothetical protein